MQTRAAAKLEEENFKNNIPTQSLDGSQSVDMNTEDCPPENGKDKSLIIKEELILYQYYTVATEYKGRDDDEISVSKDNKVQVIKIIDKLWIIVKDSNSKTGNIPRNHLNPVPIPTDNVATEYNSTEDNEISVSKDNSEKESWKRVKDSKSKTGFIPRNHLDPVPIVSTKPPNQVNYKDFYSIIILIVVIIIGVVWHWMFSTPTVQIKNNQCDVLCEVEKMEKRYINQSDEVWITLQSCLEGTLSGKFPCILLLMNAGEENIDCLLNDIGYASSRLLLGKDSGFTTLKGSKLKHEDFSFEKFKSDLNEYKVMLISGMESIQGKVLEQFHSLCDTYDPAVKLAVIAFTFNHKGIKLNATEDINDSTLAQNLIEKHWQNSIYHDTIGAIIVRLIGNVARINPIVC